MEVAENVKKTGKENAFQVIRPYGEEQIEIHAARMGGRRNLREVTITTDDDYQFVYLIKKPGRSVIQAVAEYEVKKDSTAQQKVMLGCVLEGDRDAYEHDGAVYSQLLTRIGDLLTTAKADIKKL